MKYKMSELQDLFPNRPAAVLGGGPSLPGDMERLPAGCLLIAVNEHASQICKPDFVVFSDNPRMHPELLEVVENAGGPVRVSENQEFSDVHIDMPIWTGNYSSCFAAWFGLHLGCNPVLLCGIDCYQRPQPYFHPWDKPVPAMNFDLAFHLRPWVEEGVHKLPHKERLKAMSGPLMGVFGKYEEAI